MKTIFLCVALWGGLSLAAPPNSREAQRRALAEALTAVVDKSALAKARVTVEVRSLEDGAVIYAHDSHELLNPASNVKLFTAAAALVRLGPDYRFDTDFLTEGELKDGKTKTLYVRGKGDPTMTTERLFGIVGELQHAGLKEVTGDLVLDDTWFDGERQAPGFEQEYGDKAYLAPTGALSLNGNVVGVYLRPGESLGAPGVAEVEPMSDYFVLDSELSTGPKTQRRFTVSSSVDKDKVRQKLEVRGVVPLEKGNWSAWKKIDQPALYFGFTLKSLLAQRGIKVKGKLKQAAVPAAAKMLHVAQSETLDIVLKKMNKHSSNFVAEQLIKQLGAEGRGAPGSHPKGIAVVEDFLEQDVGLARGTYVMKNGSGLNDTNRFSAAQVTQLLTVMWQRFPLAPEYLSSLGIAGKDGTLKYRFEGSDAVWRLRAKTGTLENVSALGGYVQAVGGERFVFSVMANDFPGRASGIVPQLDAVGAAVAAAGSEKGPQAAVVALTQRPRVVGSAEELAARWTIYSQLAQKADARNAPFLRVAWRAEKDPAVRALVAEALYQSDPREGSTARIFLDSVQAGDEVWGRLLAGARATRRDVPLVGSLVELASSGNADAIARLLELVHASRSDEALAPVWAEQLAVVAHDAPQELVATLARTEPATRDDAVDVLAQGLVRAAQPDAPLWSTLKGLAGAPDPKLVEYARALEVQLSQKIAEAHAPPASPALPLVPTPPASTSAPATGG